MRAWRPISGMVCAAAAPPSVSMRADTAAAANMVFISMVSWGEAAPKASLSRDRTASGSVSVADWRQNRIKGPPRAQPQIDQPRLQRVEIRRPDRCGQTLLKAWRLLFGVVFILKGAGGHFSQMYMHAPVFCQTG